MAEPKPSASLSGGLLARKGGAKPAMRRPSFSFNEEGADNGQDDLGWNDMGYDVNPDPDAPSENDTSNQPNPLAAAVPDATPEVKKQQEEIAARLQARPEGGYPAEPIGGYAAPSPLSIGGVWAPRDDETDEGDAAEELNQDEKLGYAAQEEADMQSDGDKAADAAPVATTPPAVPETEPMSASIAASGKAPKKRAAPGSKAKSAFTLRLDKSRHLKLRLACAVSNKSAQKIVTEALDQFLEEMTEIKSLVDNISENK